MYKTMTKTELLIRNRLENCSFTPGSFDQRFVFKLKSWTNKDLPGAMRDYMYGCLHRNKKQISDYETLLKQIPHEYLPEEKTYPIPPGMEGAL
jgi:hypothetical protein